MSRNIYVDLPLLLKLDQSVLKKPVPPGIISRVLQQSKSQVCIIIIISLNEIDAYKPT